MMGDGDVDIYSDLSSPAGKSQVSKLSHGGTDNGVKMPPPPSPQDESSNMSAFDLYSDLIDEEHKPKETVEKLQEEKVANQDKIDALASKIEGLQKENEDLQQQNSLLKKNISALLKTAKLEVKRKDWELTQLRLRSRNEFERESRKIPDPNPLSEVVNRFSGNYGLDSGRNNPNLIPLGKQRQIGSTSTTSLHKVTKEQPDHHGDSDRRVSPVKISAKIGEQEQLRERPKTPPYKRRPIGPHTPPGEPPTAEHSHMTDNEAEKPKSQNRTYSPISRKSKSKERSHSPGHCSPRKIERPKSHERTNHERHIRDNSQSNMRSSRRHERDISGDRVRSERKRKRSTEDTNVVTRARLDKGKAEVSRKKKDDYRSHREDVRIRETRESVRHHKLEKTRRSPEKPCNILNRLQNSPRRKSHSRKSVDRDREDEEWLRRRHNSDVARKSVKRAKEALYKPKYSPAKGDSSSCSDKMDWIRSRRALRSRSRSVVRMTSSKDDSRSCSDNKDWIRSRRALRSRSRSVVRKVSPERTVHRYRESPRECLDRLKSKSSSKSESDTVKTSKKGADMPSKRHSEAKRSSVCDTMIRNERTKGKEIKEDLEEGELSSDGEPSVSNIVSKQEERKAHEGKCSTHFIVDKSTSKISQETESAINGKNNKGAEKPVSTAAEKVEFCSKIDSTQNSNKVDETPKNLNTLENKDKNMFVSDLQNQKATSIPTEIVKESNEVKQLSKNQSITKGESESEQHKARTEDKGNDVDLKCTKHTESGQNLADQEQEVSTTIQNDESQECIPNLGKTKLVEVIDLQSVDEVNSHESTPDSSKQHGGSKLDVIKEPAITEPEIEIFVSAEEEVQLIGENTSSPKSGCTVEYIDSCIESAKEKKRNSSGEKTPAKEVSLPVELELAGPGIKKRKRSSADTAHKNEVINKKSRKGTSPEISNSEILVPESTETSKISVPLETPEIINSVSNILDCSQDNVKQQVAVPNLGIGIHEKYTIAEERPLQPLFKDHNLIAESMAEPGDNAEENVGKKKAPLRDQSQDSDKSSLLQPSGKEQNAAENLAESGDKTVEYISKDIQEKHTITEKRSLLQPLTKDHDLVAEMSSESGDINAVNSSKKRDLILGKSQESVEHQLMVSNLGRDSQEKHTIIDKSSLLQPSTKEQNVVAENVTESGDKAEENSKKRPTILNNTHGHFEHQVVVPKLARDSQEKHTNIDKSSLLQPSTKDQNLLAENVVESRDKTEETKGKKRAPTPPNVPPIAVIKVAVTLCDDSIPDDFSTQKSETDSQQKVEVQMASLQPPEKEDSRSTSPPLTYEFSSHFIETIDTPMMERSNTNLNVSESDCHSSQHSESVNSNSSSSTMTGDLRRVSDGIEKLIEDNSVQKDASKLMCKKEPQGEGVSVDHHDNNVKSGRKGLSLSQEEIKRLETVAEKALDFIFASRFPQTIQKLKECRLKETCKTPSTYSKNCDISHKNKKQHVPACAAEQPVMGIEVTENTLAKTIANKADIVSDVTLPCVLKNVIEESSSISADPESNIDSTKLEPSKFKNQEFHVISSTKVLASVNELTDKRISSERSAEKDSGQESQSQDLNSSADADKVVFKEPVAKLEEAASKPQSIVPDSKDLIDHIDDIVELHPSDTSLIDDVFQESDEIPVANMSKSPASDSDKSNVEQSHMTSTPKEKLSKSRSGRNSCKKEMFSPLGEKEQLKHRDKSSTESSSHKTCIMRSKRSRSSESSLSKVPRERGRHREHASLSGSHSSPKKVKEHTREDKSLSEKERRSTRPCDDRDNRGRSRKDCTVNYSNHDRCRDSHEASRRDDKIRSSRHDSKVYEKKSDREVSGRDRLSNERTRTSSSDSIKSIIRSVSLQIASQIDKVKSRQKCRQPEEPKPHPKVERNKLGPWGFVSCEENNMQKESPRKSNTSTSCPVSKLEEDKSKGGACVVKTTQDESLSEGEIVSDAESDAGLGKTVKDKRSLDSGVSERDHSQNCVSNRNRGRRAPVRKSPRFVSRTDRDRDRRRRDEEVAREERPKPSRQTRNTARKRRP